MKIGFHSNQLGIRGTEVALYDYALGNQEILGNESIIFAPKGSDLTTYDKFSKKFQVHLYNDFRELEKFNLDWCFWEKFGTYDGKLLNSAKNFVHAVFNVCEPHGEVYAYISEWLGNLHNHPFLPYMVTPYQQDPSINYRKFFNIPKDAIVFGRHGGFNQFSYPWVYPVIEKVLKKNKNIYFLFLNTQKFINHPRVIHFEPTYEISKKIAFINTCDAMLHSREEGESFGLAVCEFLTQNKPIITNPDGRDKNTPIILGDKGFYYTNANELYTILTEFTLTNKNYSHLIDAFSPEKVMNKFNNLINDL